VHKRVNPIFFGKDTPYQSVTVIDVVTAETASATGFDFLLLGDSLGMTRLGLETTLGVPFDLLLFLGKRIKTSVPRPALVFDMPFGSYALHRPGDTENFEKIMKEGAADGVKLEGGSEAAPLVKNLVSLGIPVLGHIGLLPQHIGIIGKYRKVGKTAEEKDSILEDARALTDAGVFAIVLEYIDEDLAVKLTESIPVPLVGIGSGRNTDGQIAVLDDLIGTTARVPRHAKSYMDFRAALTSSLQAYRKDVLDKNFPPSP